MGQQFWQPVRVWHRWPGRFLKSPAEPCSRLHSGQIFSISGTSPLWRHRPQNVSGLAMSGDSLRHRSSLRFDFRFAMVFLPSYTLLHPSSLFYGFGVPPVLLACHVQLAHLLQSPALKSHLIASHQIFAPSFADQCALLLNCAASVQNGTPRSRERERMRRARARSGY